MTGKKDRILAAYDLMRPAKSKGDVSELLRETTKEACAKALADIKANEMK